jgi:LysM repeat protein
MNCKLAFVVLMLFKISLLTAGNASKLTREDYINKYSDLAVKEMKRVGIPASITLAQGILESGNGNSMLAQKSNNHFGIKCHNEWKGKRVYHDDDAKGECFRKYKNVYDSYIDHSDFLTGKQRYASLFELRTSDYKGWAKGLKKAGYATDPRYANRIIKIIEDNNLQRFDKGKGSKVKVKDNFNPKTKTPTTKNTNSKTKPGSSPVDNFTVDALGVHKVDANNRVKYILVKEGDTFASVCQEFGLKTWEIYNYNDLSDNANIKQYRYLYLQPKRNKAHRKHTSHRIKSGETLHYVSQKYGVKVNSLYRYNDMKKGDKVKDGQVIQLRKKKK